MSPSAVSATFYPLASYAKAWVEVVWCKISTCYIVDSLVTSLIRVLENVIPNGENASGYRTSLRKREYAGIRER
jgi:hypothetical protein